MWGQNAKVLSNVLVFVKISFFLLCFARIILGLGVGIAFISSFIALYDMSNKNDIQLAFISAGILFSLGAFFANSVALFSHNFSHYLQLIVFAAPPFIAGKNQYIFLIN